MAEDLEGALLTQRHRKGGGRGELQNSLQKAGPFMQQHSHVWTQASETFWRWLVKSPLRSPLGNQIPDGFDYFFCLFLFLLSLCTQFYCFRPNVFFTSPQTHNTGCGVSAGAALAPHGVWAQF